MDANDLHLGIGKIVAPLVVIRQVVLAVDATECPEMKHDNLAFLVSELESVGVDPMVDLASIPARVASMLAAAGQEAS